MTRPRVDRSSHADKDFCVLGYGPNIQKSCVHLSQCQIKIIHWVYSPGVHVCFAVVRIRGIYFECIASVSTLHGTLVIHNSCITHDRHREFYILHTLACYTQRLYNAGDIMRKTSVN